MNNAVKRDFAARGACRFLFLTAEERKTILKNNETGKDGKKHEKSIAGTLW